MPLRLRVCLIHLACSAIIAAIAVSVIFLVWHPGAFAVLQGIDRLVLVLIGVDVVLGPVMTLILFKPTKTRRALKLDLGIVATLQLAALIYGLVSIFHARPVYVVFNVDRFTIVAASEIVRDSLQRATDPAFSSLPVGRPRIVAARLPEDPLARTDIMFSSLDGGADIYQMPELFVDYADERANVISRAHDIRELKSQNHMADANWRAFVAGFGRPPEQLGYLPVEANAREGVAIIDRASGDVLRFEALYPEWG